jgi:hypothetical protein
MPGDYENPFDRPLNSELQEHQQQQAATVQARHDLPFQTLMGEGKK